MDKSQMNPNLLFHPLIKGNLSEMGIYQMINRQGIKLLTYNFFLRPPPVKTNKDDYKEERLNDFKDRFKDFDIICLQEMYGLFNIRKEKMIKNAVDSGFFYYCEAPRPSFYSKYLIDGGLLILSRFPIIESKFERFDHGALSDSIASKGVLFAKIQIKNSFIGLFDVHFQASYFDISHSQWDFTIKTRTDQTEYLINFIYEKIFNWDKSERSRTTFILVGDFNIDYYDNELQRQKINIPKSTFDEYATFMEKLGCLGNIIDLNKNKHKTNIPFTFGVNDEEHDQVLTGREDANSNQTLDYIFEIQPNYSLPIFNDENESSHLPEIGSSSSSLKVDYDSFKVEDFTIKNRPYQQLSDHFGLSFVLNNPQQ